MASLELPGVEDVRHAQKRIAPHLHRTPVVSSRTLSEMSGVDVWLKCENLQRTGCFKPRGAINRLATLTPEQQQAGVITISAGNNAQGIAFAARALDLSAVLVMPEDAPTTKVEATRGYGAEVVLHGDVHAAFEKLEELRAERGLTLIHPFDDPMLIAGHGTVGLEILEDLDEVDAVICGIGGGGLSGGLGVALAGSKVSLYGVEPEGAATMTRALEAGETVRLDTVDTIAEGLAPPFVGELNLLAAQRHVNAVALVTDDQIRDAMRLLLERTKNVVEPSGAAALAGLLAGAFPISPGSRVVVVISGGNVDLHRLGELLG